MDLTHDNRALSYVYGLSKRIRALPKSHFRLSRRHSEILIHASSVLRSKVVAGLLLCAGAGVAGTFAHQGAKHEAIEDWHHEHFPSVATWSATLANQGFLPLKDPARLHRALRTLPLTLDAPHTVWMSADLNWVAVFEDEPLIFTRASDGVPSQWSPDGVAWIGFDRVQQELGRKNPGVLARVAAKAGAHAKPRLKEVLDPRALRF